MKRSLRPPFAVCVWARPQPVPCVPVLCLSWGLAYPTSPGHWQNEAQTPRSSAILLWAHVLVPASETLDCKIKLGDRPGVRKEGNCKPKEKGWIAWLCTQFWALYPTADCWDRSHILQQSPATLCHRGPPSAALTFLCLAIPCFSQL